MEAEEIPYVLCTAAVRLIQGMITAGAEFREAGWIVSLTTFYPKASL